MARLHITCDGRDWTTVVRIAETGEIVNGVVGVKWEVDLEQSDGKGSPRCVLTMEDVSVDVVGESD